MLEGVILKGIGGFYYIDTNVGQEGFSERKGFARP